MKTVYAAGPVTGWGYEAAILWRHVAAEYLQKHGIAVYSPLRKQSELGEMGVIGAQYVDRTQYLTNKFIHRRDRFDVQCCDLLLVSLIGAKRVSVGTMYEIGVADALGKPIVLAMEETGNPHENQLLREVSWFTETNLEDALDAVRSILLP